MMKRFKSVIAAAVAAVTCMSVCACGGDKEDSTKTYLDVGVFDAGLGTVYFDEMKKDFEAYYANESFEDGKTGVVLRPTKKNTEFNPAQLLTSMKDYQPVLYLLNTGDYEAFTSAELFTDVSDVMTEKYLDENGEIAKDTGKTATQSIEDTMLDGYSDVFKKDDGKYYAVLNYRNAGGQRKTKWISLGLPEKGNKRKAEAELARLRAEFEPPKEVGVLSSDMLFADYLLEWLEIAKGRLAVATYSSYAAMIKRPVGPYFRQRNLTLRELEARHLQMFYSEMLRKVKPNTVIHYHAIIHSALKYAVKTDMLVQNVADKVDRPKKNSFQPVFLSAEEMQKMFEALRGTKLELPVLVAAFYGFRRGEVLGLKWDAIDFERGTISVIRTVTTITVDGKQTEIEQQSAKTKSSLRTLPLIGSFREYFLQVKEAQELNKQICGNCYNHEYDGFVFVDELGERMRANYLTSAFPKFLEDHGLRRMRFHDLRHSCASLLLANGVPLKHIQEWLGHSDFTTTANIYAHLDYKSKITSAQAMETGLALPEGGDFGSRWGSIDVGENG
mgnify:CR=1 FL=1